MSISQIKNKILLLLVIYILLNIITINSTGSIDPGTSESITTPIGTTYHFSSSAYSKEWNDTTRNSVSVNLIVTSFGELTSKITKASVRLELIDSNKKSLHKGDHIIDDMVTGTLSSVRTIIQLSSPENGPKITYFNISASVKFHQTKAAYIGTVIGGDYQGPLLFVSRVNVTSSVELLGTNKQTDSPLNYQVWTILPVLFIVPFIRKYNWL